MDNDPDYKGAARVSSASRLPEADPFSALPVIADAFIEGSYAEGLDKPHLVYLYRRPFAFAGIWDVWKNPETEQEALFRHHHDNGQSFVTKRSPHPSQSGHSARRGRTPVGCRLSTLQEITTLLSPIRPKR